MGMIERLDIGIRLGGQKSIQADEFTTQSQFIHDEHIGVDVLPDAFGNIKLVVAEQLPPATSEQTMRYNGSEWEATSQLLLRDEGSTEIQSLQFEEYVMTLPAGQQNDVATDNKSFYTVQTDPTTTVTGFSASLGASTPPAGTRLLFLLVQPGDTLTLINNSSSSAFGCRIITGTGGNITGTRFLLTYVGFHWYVFLYS